MPCSSDGYPPTREEILAAKMPAVLCGVILKYGLGHVDQIDWGEAGVSQAEFREWWKLHSGRDRQRREREILEKVRRDAKAQAIAKLTPAERAVLGL